VDDMLVVCWIDNGLPAESYPRPSSNTLGREDFPKQPTTVGKGHFEKNFEYPLKIKPETASPVQPEHRTSTGSI